MTSNDRNAAIILLGGFTLLAVSFGARISFGVFLPTMPASLGFDIAAISWVLAVQNLMWGAAQPFAGRLSDRYGAAPVVFAGAVLYAGGLAMTAYAQNYYLFGLSAGVILGMAQRRSVSRLSWALSTHGVGSVSGPVPGDRNGGG